MVGGGDTEWVAVGQLAAAPGQCAHAAAPQDQRSLYSYDERNRPKTLNHPNGTADLSFEYEADGLLKAVSVIEGGIVQNRWDYAYNKRRLLEHETLSVIGRSYAIDHNYDAYGSRSQLIYPDGTSLSLAPNRLGQPKAVGTLASGARYWPSGAVRAFSYANGVTYDSSLNTRQLPGQVQISHGILDESYGWDQAGNLLSVTDHRSAATSRTRAFEYDPANRLTSAIYAAPNLGPYGYQYDIHDNLIEATRPAALGGDRNYQYHPTTRRLMRLHTDGDLTQIGYDYDANGNATLRDASGLGLDAYGYVYDRANRLLTVRDAVDETDVKARYQYDGHARRVLIEEAGEPRVQVYSQGGQYLFEEPDLISDASFSTGASAHGKPSTRYQYLGGMLVARSSGNQTTFLHTDHLGSPIAESTAAPVQVTHLPLHEPYGAPTDGNYLDGPGYTGHVVDGLTGLSYMQARYYDPIAGRFLGVDPVHVDLRGGGNFSRYWYGNNNPATFLDPDGQAGDHGDEFAALGEYIAEEIARYRWRKTQDPELKRRLGFYLAVTSRVKYNDERSASFYDIESRPVTSRGPGTILYIQEGISENFKDGRGSVQDMIDGLRSGELDPESVPAIRVFYDKDGNLRTLDHRRLYAFQQAGVEGLQIRTVDATPREIMDEVRRKWDRGPNDDGRSIQVRPRGKKRGR